VTTRNEFEAARSENPVVPVTRELFADADTPVNIYRKLAHGRPGTFLLESADQGIFTRYSFVGARVFGVLTEQNGRAHWQQTPGSSRLSEQRLLPGGVEHLQPVEALRAVYERWKCQEVPNLPPLASGLVGYLGWESIAEFEHVQFPDEVPEVPRQHLGLVSDLVVIDHRTGSLLLVANVLCDEGDSGELWADAQRRLDRLEAELQEPQAVALGQLDRTAEPQIRRTMSQEDYYELVRTAKAHIVDGDIFQVVLAQRFETDCSADPLDVYRVLRYLNPSPYLYLLSCTGVDAQPFYVVGSSPEALVTVSGSHVLTHPIAGSRPRGSSVDEDQRLEQELLADPKERSEHLMLVDLSRNDISKVSEPGSVEVSEFMRIERFSHIMHISSTVEGKLRDNLNPVDALEATFPAGTLSGAPKPWALRIINKLEPVRRGVYGGVVGYVGLSGHADLAIAIRTATLLGDTAIVQAGGGIVADSQPELEEEESRNKAAAPLRAVAVANTLHSPDREHSQSDRS
jgi:anthranilate synthase component 1